MKILTIPHKILYQEAVPVEVFGSSLQFLIDRMFITMYQAKGVGLAANQVGVLKQIIVLNTEGFTPMTLINPTVHHIHNGRIWERESCLSVPHYSIPVERSSEISVKARDRHGFKLNFHAEGFLARVIQHETDHLQGMLINEKRTD